jgi:hypothetical protein
LFLCASCGGPHFDHVTVTEQLIEHSGDGPPSPSNLPQSSTGRLEDSRGTSYVVNLVITWRTEVLVGYRHCRADRRFYGSAPAMRTASAMAIVVIIILAIVILLLIIVIVLPGPLPSRLLAVTVPVVFFLSWLGQHPRRLTPLRSFWYPARSEGMVNILPLARGSVREQE